MSWSDRLEDQSLYVNTKELEAFQSSGVFSYTQVPAGRTAALMHGALECSGPVPRQVASKLEICAGGEANY